ncbi:cation diffusion facilitator family transporter [Caproiciproducens sp. MSJ-32]|uniref:cation diffusion facilitator family transporter n=1 Tax=Caproiciproducens sp. MSJ-32 TaxID=2841527 RepID=UPI001C1257D8|nr:cation diffusion facilitator family transporter [Caproiciproducens sp. MSJ-32]MBU5455007.1 cation diffusion facilitator family transporter [Caproiciproducens sp. MSJ-32]
MKDYKKEHEHKHEHIHNHINDNHSYNHGHNHKHNHNHNHNHNHSHNHSHSHIHGHHHHHGASSNIKVAFLLNFSFAILEIVGGFWTNSMGILSDALHDLGDSLSLGVAWFLEKYSEKGPDGKFSFGYSRFSLLGALINSLILVVGSILILKEAIPRIINPEPVNAKGMLLFAILGIAINGAAVLRLRKGTSLNEKVVSWHLMEDVLGWVVILIASIILLFVDIPIIDPILSLLTTIYVLYNVVKNLKEILNVFLQGVPGNFSIAEIEEEIAESTGALSVHHTHIWSLEGEKNMLSTHIVVKDDTKFQEIAYIKDQTRELLRKKGIEHVTIEIDFESENCEDQVCD